MTNLKQAVKNFWNDEEGATAIEYGLLVALIALVIIVAVIAVGTNLNIVFQSVANCLKAPNGTTCKLP